MIKKICLIIFSMICFFLQNSFAERYGEKICQENGYICVKVQKGQTWESMFPDPDKRDIVMRVNRMNTQLHSGFVIAIPNNLEFINYMSESPMPRNIESSNYETIVINLNLQAFGAYNSNGKLVRWGPISAGRSWCSDVERPCLTPTGRYTIYRKDDEMCVSNIYPINEGGAPMPYCMFFYNGYALHGSPLVPGYHDSHGCIRLFIEDAKWLNQEFINPGKTKVIIEALNRKIYFFLDNSFGYSDNLIFATNKI